MHEFLKEMNEKVLSKYDTMTVGELPCTPDVNEIRRYVSAQERELNMVGPQALLVYLVSIN
jgi:alpha-glucosidase